MAFFELKRHEKEVFIPIALPDDYAQFALHF